MLFLSDLVKYNGVGWGSLKTAVIARCAVDRVDVWFAAQLALLNGAIVGK